MTDKSRMRRIQSGITDKVRNEDTRRMASGIMDDVMLVMLLKICIALFALSALLLKICVALLALLALLALFAFSKRSHFQHITKQSAKSAKSAVLFFYVSHAWLTAFGVDYYTNISLSRLANIFAVGVSDFRDKAYAQNRHPLQG